MTETGTVQVDDHQFLLTAAGADTTQVTGRGTLIRTGPGFVTVVTGTAHGPTTLTLDTTSGADPRISDWETIEETVVHAADTLRVTTPDAHTPADFTPIPAGRYRVRVHARGRSTHPDPDVTAPTETYHITLTPTTAPAGIVAALTAADHTPSRSRGRIPVIDHDRVWVPIPDGSYLEVHRGSPRAHAVYATRGRWGPRPPHAPLLDEPILRVAASAVAELDHTLLDTITALPPQRQHRLARRCARWAFERAGLTRIPDFRAALDALDQGREPPAALATHALAHHRLDTDPTIELTVIPGFGARPSIVPQLEAIAAYEYARLPHPLRAALEAVRFAAETYGQHHRRLLTRIHHDLRPLEQMSDRGDPDANTR
ncbi:hypothetical protein ACWEKT_38295 [Nocardia takedensis]|uniref:hypothetical protein n=1 Tax=Nocardia takedensis TaxID=259390 RepID=UPI0002E47592|nr:hypothetical protein [Nocardia takedensis]